MCQSCVCNGAYDVDSTHTSTLIYAKCRVDKINTIQPN